MTGPNWTLKTFLLCLAVSILISGGVDMRLLTDGPSASENNGYGYGYAEGYFKKWKIRGWT